MNRPDTAVFRRHQAPALNELAPPLHQATSWPACPTHQAVHKSGTVWKSFISDFQLLHHFHEVMTMAILHAVTSTCALSKQMFLLNSSAPLIAEQRFHRTTQINKAPPTQQQQMFSYFVDQAPRSDDTTPAQSSLKKANHKAMWEQHLGQLSAWRSTRSHQAKVAGFRRCQQC